MGLNLLVISAPPPPPTNWGAPLQVSRVRYPCRSSAAEVSPGSVGRGSRGLRSLRAPPPGLSHSVARVPTRGCCGERGPDAAGPGAQRGALGRPPAQRRHRSGLLGTVGGLRALGLHGVHPEEAARAAAAALLQGEVRGAGGGRPGRAGPGGSRGFSCRPRPAAEPRVGLAGRGTSGREGRAVPAPARTPARPPSPAGVSPPTLRALQPACVGGCWRSARGRAVAVSRGPGRTWVESSGLPLIRSPPGTRTSAPCVLPRAFL